MALKYLGSEQAATQLAIVNNLDPPFIVDAANYQSSAAATGAVTFTLTGSDPVTILSGTEVQTSPGPSGVVRSYTTTAVITLTSTGNTASASVICTVPGPSGNVAPGRIQVVVGVSGVSVSNPGALTGGYAYHILTIGDRIWIPTQTSVGVQSTVRSSLERENAFGGTGIYVTPTGGFQWGTEDLVLAHGPEEIGVEAANRLRTRIGSLWYAPSEGSLLPALKGTEYQSAAAQAAILAQSSVLQDNRIQAATFTANPYSDTWLELQGTLELAVGTQVQTTAALQ